MQTKMQIADHHQQTEKDKEETKNETG